MLTTRTFITQNRIGNVLKIVREHYIRDDIYCGIPHCTQCRSLCESYLSSSHVNECKLIDGNHYLILDTNVILDQIDLLEEPTISNVIILNTVYKEVKHRSLPIFQRLNTILDNPNRHFYLFINDHFKPTYLAKRKSELVNDYNDRSIRQACSWYSKHLPKEKFILLTDDVNNRKLASEEQISCYSIKYYIENLENNSLLLDKLSRKDFSSESEGNNIYFPHLSTVELLKGIKNGTLHQGTFRASANNYLEGFVNVDHLEEPVLVQGREGLNRAVDGDVVVVEIFQKSQWVCPSDIILEDDSEEVENDVEVKKQEKILITSLTNEAEIKPTGKVVGIIKRKWRQYCGILQDSGRGGLFHLFVPSNKCIPKIRIQTRQAEFLKTQKFLVAIDSWPLNSRYPNGHFIRALGKIGSQTTENEVILLEHDVPHSQFSNEVLQCLPKLPWLISEKDIAERVDLRHLDICSVDPPGCTDIDDALHCRVLENNKLEVGVHIADVSHFIRPGTALDLEAASRATTVYLVNKRIDMVPELLSSNLCSLRGGEERFAFSCIWEMDTNANILNTKFHKSIIKSKRAMTYEEAQIAIDTKSNNDPVTLGLRQLNKLAKKLKKRRLDNGALVLASGEVKIHMDSETMEPIDVEAKKMYETNSMVEEFMLLANISVANKILEEFPDCAMLRRHPIPPPLNYDPLIKAAKHLGFDIDVSSGKNLAKSLDRAVKPSNPYFNTMLRMLATRSMLQAVYFTSGTLQKNEYYHFGLAVPLYTHFTSPIRRYADIIVHRLLAVTCKSDITYPELLNKQRSTELCQNLNYRNRMAQYAGRASVTFNTHLFFKGKLTDEEGYILFVKKNALQILLPKYGIETVLYLNDKNGKGIFQYDEENHVQKSGDVVLHAFDPVTVRLKLDSTNVQHEKFVLQLVKPFIEGFSVLPLATSDETSEKETIPEVKNKKRKIK